MKRVSHPSVVDLFRPDNERYKMIPEAPPHQPPCQPSRADRLSSKLLLLLLGQQWKHFTGAVNLLARFSLWYLLSPLLPPPPSTYISPFRLREAPQSLKDISGSREEIRQIKTRKSSFFPPHLQICSHFLSIKSERFTKGLGEIPLVLPFPVHMLCLTWFSFFLKVTRPSGSGLSHSQVKLYFHFTSTEELFFLLLDSWSAGNVTEYEMMW